MTCARTILRCWKEPEIPTLNVWRIQMMGTVVRDKILGKLNWQNDKSNEQWVSYGRYMTGGNSFTITPRPNALLGIMDYPSCINVY